MQISEKWLREWVNPSVDTATLAEQLTMAGLEVDAIRPVAGEFSDVLVGELVEVAPHPDADKLRVCQVSTGKERFQVVCGAPNARAGLKAPFATVGAVLPGDFKIKKAKLRGVESFGMLCAEAELGLSEASEGLMELPADAPAGACLRDYLQLDDTLIEVDLTPNRADCLGVLGVARDVAVLNDVALGGPKLAPVSPSIDDSFPVRIEAVADCPRYAGRVIRGVDLSRATPLWMVEKLRRSGIRSIDPAVDVTNYVMLELGQPLHAFDLSSLTDSVVVRHAVEGESLTLLDGKAVELTADTLLIADEKQPLALAGIMGGEGSGVTTDTKDLFLESAFFDPQLIAGRARQYGLHTDASHRFERGVDPELSPVAIERATELLLQICGGQAGPVQVTDTDALPATRSVELRRNRIEKMLGVALEDGRVEVILNGLGLTTSPTDSGWQVAVPSWRFDIALEVDLLEELARVHGYNALPVRPIRSELVMAARPEDTRPLTQLRQQLVALDYQEAVTYSFVDPAVQAQLDPELTPVALMNPIASDMGVMRTQLWPGLLKALRHNLNRQHKRVRLFETGLRFIPQESGIKQDKRLAMVISGPRDPEGWTGDKAAVDFYDLKGDIETLIHPSVACDFEVSNHPALHPGQCARLMADGVEVGVMGALHPKLQQAMEFEQPVLLMECDAQWLVGSDLPAFNGLSRFPEVRRDLALLVNASLPAAELLAAARVAAGDLLTDLTIFDVYQGKGIAEDKKSLAIALVFRHPERTLDDAEVTEAMTAVQQAVKDQFGAELR